MGIQTDSRLFIKHGFGKPFLKSMAQLARQFDWSQDPRRLPRAYRTDLIDADTRVSLTVSPGVFGETPAEDLITICSMVRAKSPKRIFEFGTFTGATTLNLAMNAPDDATIVTLDLSAEERAAMAGERWEKTFTDDSVGQRFRGTPHEGQIHQLLMDSRRLDERPFIGSMDFVFIDACHEYELVKNDSEKAFRMLAQGGVVMWHDYTPGFPGVCRYLEDLNREKHVRWVQGTSVALHADGM